MKTIMYPKRCRKGIHIITEATGMDVETAYAMMLMTAALMDLDPGDYEVVQIVLEDCGLEDCA